MVPSRGPRAILGGSRWFPLAPVGEFRDRVFLNTLHDVGTIGWKPTGVLFPECKNVAPHVHETRLGIQRINLGARQNYPVNENSRPYSKRTSF